MSITISPAPQSATLKPTITVVGVGGAGGNAVNNMISAQLEGVSFVIANTDAQALDNAKTDNVIQLGTNITQGLGAGANPDVGSAAAEEAAADIMDQIEGSHMVFITAGMGGGTGTGAAPVVARMAKEQGILTVAVVTKPFHFEGSHRMKLAESGLEELQRYVDTMIVIPNQNLFRVANEKTTFADAFRMADEVLHSGVRGVTDLMIMPGLINLDFSDIRTVMREMGKAMMGTGEAEGERRAIDAAEAAISNPLLDDVSMKGARGVLINITGGHDMTLFEVDEAANRIRDEVDPDANIIFGSTFHENMEGQMRVSVVATGIEQPGSKHGRTGGGNAEPRSAAPSYSVRNGITTANKDSASAMAEKPVRFAAVRPKPVMQLESKPMMQEEAPAETQMANPQPKPLMRSMPTPQVQPVDGAQMDIEDSQELFHFQHEEEHAEMQAAHPEPAEPAIRPARMGRHSPTRAEISPRQEAEATAHYQETMQTQIQPQAATAMAEPQWEEDYAEEEEEGDQPSLLQRMTSRLAPQQEERPQRRRVEIARSNPEPAAQPEHDLEIPAFLRRQAN